MKQYILFGFIFLLVSCNQSAQKEKLLKSRVDSLEKKLADTYKPGFGEFMSNIQAHHAKLWFAGQNQNWKLCDFEIHEIMESFDAIKKYQAERKESQMVDMIQPAIDSINNAIQKRNTILFKSSYNLLTNTCNNCHHAVQFEFNVVRIPEVQSFSNQDFKTMEK
jgi:thymidylate synthase